MDQPFPAKQRGWPRWVVGCLVAAGVFFVLLILGVVLVVENIRTIGTNLIHAQLVALIEQSPLPADQKSRVVARLDQLAADFKAGKVTNEQMGRLVQALGQSPLLPLAGVYGVEVKYIKPSALTPAEKDQAVLSLQRFARGVFEKKIPSSAINDVIAPLSTKDAMGHPQLKQQVSTQELETFIAAAKTKADDAKVPNEPFELNVADELDKAIDKAMAGGPAATEPGTEPGEVPATEPGAETRPE